MSHLIHEDTGREVKAGDRLVTFRGIPCVVVSWIAPRHSGSTGRIYVRFDGFDAEHEFFPSVCGCKIVEGNHDAA